MSTFQKLTAQASISARELANGGVRNCEVLKSWREFDRTVRVGEFDALELLPLPGRSELWKKAVRLDLSPQSQTFTWVVSGFLLMNQFRCTWACRIPIDPNK